VFVYVVTHKHKFNTSQGRKGCNPNVKQLNQNIFRFDACKFIVPKPESIIAEVDALEARRKKKKKKKKKKNGPWTRLGISKISNVDVSGSEAMVPVFENDPPPHEQYPQYVQTLHILHLAEPFGTTS
jgi:hypothetical protein